MNFCQQSNLKSEIKELSDLTNRKAQSNFKSKFVSRMVFLQAVPALPATLGMAIGSIADAVFVGSAIGEVGLAAIGLSYPVFMALNAICLGFANSEALMLCVYAIRIACASALPAGVSIILCADSQSRNRECLAMAVCLLKNCLLLVLFAYLFNSIIPDYVWWFLPLTEVVTLLLIAPLVKKYNNNEITKSLGLSLTISKFSDLGDALNKCLAFCNQYATQPQFETAYSAIDEICAVIFEKNPLANIRITVFLNEDMGLTICLRDSAPQFNPFDMKTSKIRFETDLSDENLAALGLLLVRKRVKSWNYRHYLSFNTLTIKM